MTTKQTPESVRSTAGLAAHKPVARLRQQNFYQRLGLTNECIHADAVHAAHAVRSRMLRESYNHLPPADQQAIQALLDEARQTLSDDHFRRSYDAQLTQANSTQTQPIQAQPAKSLAAKSLPAKEQLAKEQLANEQLANGQPASVAQTTSASTATSDLDPLSDRYRIQNVLAEGERSIIYSGWDARLNRRVIIKKMRHEIAQTAAHRELFRSEAELFAGCNAGNLVTILDYDADTGTMVLERLSKDLSSLVSDKGCSHRLVREMLRDALTGLASLHAHGIAHGRIELRHLLMDDNSGVKLAVTPGMTGLATALRPGPHALHLAPELLNPHLFGEPGLAVDIYALGFAALELLCGNKLARRISPAIGESENMSNGWLLWHSSPTDHLPPLSSLVPGIPEDLDRLLTQMTSKQQHERFANAQAAREALSESLGPGVTAAPESVREVDTRETIDVIGSPPPLRPGYDYEERVSWQDVFRNPRCLLTPQGRNHAYGLGLVCLMAVSILIMLTRPIATTRLATNQPLVTIEEEPMDGLNSFDAQPEPETIAIPEPLLNANTPIEDTHASLKPESSTVVAVDPEPVGRWQVAFKVHPAGRVLSIVGHKPDTQSPDLWHLLPGSYTVQCRLDSTGHMFESTVAIPDGNGRLTVDIDAPPPTANAMVTEVEDPFADVRSMRYHPLNTRLRYIGSDNPQHTEAQKKVIRAALNSLVNRRNLPARGTMPFTLHEHAVDPRAAFTLALVAYHQGQTMLAIQYCERSLRDAEQLRCPFVLPVRLLTQIHVINGQYSAALLRCRASLEWINSQSKQTADPAFREAGNHIAWWAGGILEFVTSTRHKHTHSQVDIVGLETVLREMCSDEQWTRLRIARCEVSGKASSLLADHKVYLNHAQAERSQKQVQPEASEGDLEHAPEADAHREPAVALSTVRYASMFSLPPEKRAQHYAQQPSEQSPASRSAAGLLPPGLRVSPYQFQSYRPCDIGALADATAMSMN